jgi:hypothetical protein
MLGVITTRSSRIYREFTLGCSTFDLTENGTSSVYYCILLLFFYFFFCTVRSTTGTVTGTVPP